MEILGDGLIVYTLIKFNESNDPKLKQRLTSGEPIFVERKYATVGREGITKIKVLAPDIQKHLGINIEVPIIDSNVEPDEEDVINMLRRLQKQQDLIEKFKIE